jgi:hypothetical protein
MTYQHDKIPTTYPHMYYLKFSLISTINYHGSFELFTNPPNPTTHLPSKSEKQLHFH